MGLIMYMVACENILVGDKLHGAAIHGNMGSPKVKWCEETLGPSWTKTPSGGERFRWRRLDERNFMFADAQDATVFKLAWG